MESNPLEDEDEDEDEDPREFFRSLGAAEYAYLCGICEVFGIPQTGLLFCVFFRAGTLRMLLEAF